MRTSVILATIAFAVTAVAPLAWRAVGRTDPWQAANVLSIRAAHAAAEKSNIPYAEAKPIFQALREDLWPAEFRAKTAADREAAWPAWVSARDATIRARVEQGDEDSLIHLLLFGAAFTKQPLVTQDELAALAVRPVEALSPLRRRVDDFVAAVASPGTNDRLEFAHDVIARKGIDIATEAGRNQARRYLEERMQNWAATAVRSANVLGDPNADLADRLTLFRDRGLTSNTSILINIAIEQTLQAIKSEGLIRPGAVRRVAVIGPGLDFTDKLDGYDFYPQQTTQPFAIIDSLIRLGLSKQDQVEVTAFDVSPRIIQHLEAARARARTGASYPLVLARNPDRPWTPIALKAWEQFGDRIGDQTKVAPPPPSAGRVEVRGVLVRPSIVLSAIPRDLNMVVERLEPSSSEDHFDLILATNILIYYDVFDQSLAAANVAKMLGPGGLFLTNDRIFELPGGAVRSVGETSVPYMEQPSGLGDRIVWYQAANRN